RTGRRPGRRSPGGRTRVRASPLPYRDRSFASPWVVVPNEYAPDRRPAVRCGRATLAGGRPESEGGEDGVRAARRASRDGHGERRPTTHRGGVQPGGAHVDVPLGEAVQHLVQGDPALEAGEGGAEAEVDAVAERQVVRDPPVDVERVAVRGEGAVIAVGRGGEEQHGAALGDRLPVVVDLARDVPA